MTLRNYSSTAAETTLSGGVDASTTTLTVSATTGFPAVPFVLAIDAGAAAQELVLVTNVAGTTLTVTRAFDSTVASAHDTGAVVAHSHAAIDFREANAHVNATSGVHGATGAVVGTSDAQTLTNKTVALGSNTVSGTKAQFNAALTDADFATTDAVPLGTLGYAQVTTSQDITTLTDWTGLAVTVTVGAGRRIRVTGSLYYNHNTNGGHGFGYIYEGATQLQQRGTVLPSLGISDPLEVCAILTPTAGAHTYKLRGTTNTGTLTLATGPSAPVFILVEDIGPA